MDCSNGNIGPVDALIRNGSDRKNLVPINMKDATEKQRKEKRVRINDHRSKLGRLLTKKRSEMSKNQAKRARRKERAVGLRKN